MRIRTAGAVLLVLATGAFGVALLAPEPTLAGHGKNCGIVTKGSKDYRVWGQRMKCRRAKRGTRIYLREGRALRGFSSVSYTHLTLPTTPYV